MPASVTHKTSALLGFNVWALVTIAITTLASLWEPNLFRLVHSPYHQPFPRLSGLDAASKTQRPSPDRTLGKKCRQRLRPCRAGDNKMFTSWPKHPGVFQVLLSALHGLLEPVMTLSNTVSLLLFCPASFPLACGFPSFPLLLSWALTFILLTLAPLAPSSPFRAARLPWGSKVICAVSLPWGSKVICCSPYGTIVLDSLWLTSLSVEHSGPVTHINHWNSSALLRLFWLVFPTSLSFHDPTPLFFSWPFQLADRPCSTPVLLSWWSRFEFLAAPRIRHLTAFLSGFWGGFRFSR